MMPAPLLEPELLAEVVRPDGRTYRPRKRPVAVLLSDRDDAAWWIYVLRTHDLERAHRLAASLAAREGFQLAANQPHWLMWTRCAMRDGERTYVDDPVRGAPAVCFELEW